MGGMGQMTDKFSVLSGLGIRPDWIRQNPEKAAAAGAVAAAPFTGGASLGALGAAEGAGAGAAAAGAGAAATGAAATGAGATAAELAATGAGAAGAAGGAGGVTSGLLADTGANALATGMGTAAGSAPSFGAGGMGMMDASGAAGMGGTSSSVGAAGGAANPFSVGLGNMQNSTMGQNLHNGMKAYNTYQRGQQAMNMANPGNRTINQTDATGGGAPQGQQMSPMSGIMGGQSMQNGMPNFTGGGPGVPGGAREMILKRLGLLGGMQ